MKIKFFTILIILISNIGYSQFDYPQELSFNKKLVSATYKDQNGNQKQSKISTLDGNFKFSIIKAAEQKNSPIIQIFGDNEQKGYYVFVEKLDNVKIGGFLYECNHFFSTNLNTGFNVYLAFDKSHIIFRKGDKIIEYFNFELMERSGR